LQLLQIQIWVVPAAVAEAQAEAQAEAVAVLLAIVARHSADLLLLDASDLPLVMWVCKYFVLRLWLWLLL
jgi:uncharacterized protein GlcG (DUF336 family)